MKTDILDTLFRSRTVVSELLIATVPSTPEETQLLRRLLQRRDGITGAINQIIEANFAISVVNLPERILELESASDDLQAIASNLDGVRAAVGIVDELIGVVLQIAGLPVTA